MNNGGLGASSSHDSHRNISFIEQQQQFKEEPMDLIGGGMQAFPLKYENLLGNDDQMEDLTIDAKD